MVRMPDQREDLFTTVNATRLAGSLLQAGTSETPDDLDPYVSSMGPAWDNTFAILLALIIFTGAFINLVVLCTLAKLRCRIHTTMDFYILALAISDTLVLLTCYPLTLVSTIAHKWLFGRTGCVINGFLGFFFSFMDVGTLCIMSVVRMLIVKLPYYRVVKKRSCTGFLLFGVFSYALVFSLCPIFGWGDYSPEPFGTSCTINWKLPDKSYVTTVFVVVLVVPMLVMTCSYFSIVCHMKSNASRLDRHSTTSNRRRNCGRQRKLIRMTVVMCVCFLLTWTPYAVVSICFAYVPGFELDPVVSAVPTVLAKTSHIVNPVVYFATNSTYRTKLQQFWARKFQLSRSLERKTTKATMTEQYERSRSIRSISSCSGLVHIPSSPTLLASSTIIPLVPLCIQAATSSSGNGFTSTSPDSISEKSITKKTLLLLHYDSSVMGSDDVLI